MPIPIIPALQKEANNLEEDDEEDDSDYKPPTGEQESDSDSDTSDDERKAKRARTAAGEMTEEDIEAEKEKERLRVSALWENFQTSVSTPSIVAKQNDALEVTMVKIVKKYLFAGDFITEVVDVPEDSSEAKKWPRWNPDTSTEAAESLTTTSAVSTAPSPNVTSPSASTNAPAVAVPGPATPGPATSTTKSTASAKRPGPRKSKISLSTPGVGSKAKKLTTLDKSAMDWKAHVQAEQGKVGLQDELEANRRGGGYLEKVEFLQRVEERKEGTLEALKSGKRRRA